LTCSDTEGAEEVGVEEGGEEGVVRGEEVTAGQHGWQAC